MIRERTKCRWGKAAVRAKMGERGKRATTEEEQAEPRAGARELGARVDRLARRATLELAAALGPQELAAWEAEATAARGARQGCALSRSTMRPEDRYLLLSWQGNGMTSIYPQPRP